MDENKELMEKFSRVSLLLLRNNYRRNMEALGDPCRGQSRVLSLLKSCPKMSQKELSNLLHIRAQSLGELLTKLERNGYIVRSPSDTDRRAMDLQLTPEGAEAAERLEEGMLDSVKVFDCLNVEEKNSLTDCLDKLIEKLKNETGDDPEKDGCFYPAFHKRGGIYCRNGDFHEPIPEYGMPPWR
ncbi:MAG: MarR family transcriptional regulator [Lawsonibacter sp.]|nr:MarR family transcriptional regulator [Lawsonibacter sp.]